ncbi:hypothetical protein AMTRI_Chr03g139980 [Amborella trichopoda]|uniref:PHD-type domain-containing protein n=1 Tax=Amborella trichopoda TaxID=13333 RepID=W1NZX2_AMBTC|nr:uncharacterized protein LOC18428938 [Amborella trichopoda]ERN00866.1 hypothetical protein AMTR_s00103p00114590 [Amborella trichopoda]|eukprot:XP_006838297.1 uncharacterized protein LOC18428938 [Amborella trichopoda]
MAFHVACPITCQRICFCTLGFPENLQSEKGRRAFVDEVNVLEDILKDPWFLRAGGRKTLQVQVPHVEKGDGLSKKQGDSVTGVDGEGEELQSVQTKRVSLQKKAIAASLAAEDLARRFETGNFADVSGASIKDQNGDDRDGSAVKVMCRMCFSAESEGSSRAARMLSCKTCNKKYHRNCLKSWANHRDLFDWHSWVCASCRICEVCRRSGDPNKLMFCKRCDAACHSYCQQPPHKNVTPGPYLCPKHTRCHSCGSTVPGSGSSTRWFLGYTCCDACGRLFVKGKYCPVCLKVYRDSESTPMVCCDACGRWVHCHCDGISDEKYQEFQTDRNLYYKCACCRGDCYEVRDLDDAVQELWRRRDDAEQDQIANSRAAAGLITHEDRVPLSPSSDDEQHPHIVSKGEFGRTLKFSVKGISEKVLKSVKEQGKYSNNGLLSKKYAKKKTSQTQSNGKTEGLNEMLGAHAENSLGDHKVDGSRLEVASAAGSMPSNTLSIGNESENSPISQSGIGSKVFVQGAAVHSDTRNPKIVKIKSSKSRVVDLEDASGKLASAPEGGKRPKIVIHLSKKGTANDVSRSDASNSHREQSSAASGSEDVSQKEMHILGLHDQIAMIDDDRGFKDDISSHPSTLMERGKPGGVIKHCNIKPEDSRLGSPNVGGETDKGAFESIPEERIPSVTGKRKTRGNTSEEDIFLRNDTPAIVDSSSSKLSLKFKLKNPSHSLWGPQGDGDEKNSVKGQRSKRKRPISLAENGSFVPRDDPINEVGDPINEVLDANWILKKLGKDAVGKRVEVHQPSDNSWHEGVVTNMIEGSSTLSVQLDDGRDRTLDLGKQGIRFISQKHRRLR